MTGVAELIGISIAILVVKAILAAGVGYGLYMTLYHVLTSVQHLTRVAQSPGPGKET